MRDLLDDGASRVGETATITASYRVLVVSAVQEDNVMIKKILMGLGIAVLVLVAVAAVGVFLARQGERLDASSKAYANRTIPLIVSAWSEQALVQNAPELLHAASKPDFDRYFAAFAKLGPLVHYDGAKGQSNITVLAGKGRIVTADYVAHAKFAHGSAEIDLGLIREQGHWKIDAFRVNSPSLL